MTNTIHACLMKVARGVYRVLVQILVCFFQFSLGSKNKDTHKKVSIKHNKRNQRQNKLKKKKINLQKSESFAGKTVPT